MNLLEVILLFVIVGVLLWLINTYVPMEPTVKQLMNVAVIIILVLWLVVRLFPGIAGIRF